MSKNIQLKVKEIIQETNDTITIVFDINKNISYRPGQFLRLKIKIDNEEIVRAYSLCTSPYTDENLAITIKKVEGGVASNYLNNNLKVGDLIMSDIPRGSFTIDLSSSNQRNLVFIGAGSGITPLMSILKSALFKERNSNIKLIFANSNEESIIYKNDINNLKNEYGDRFHVIHVLSRPSDSWDGIRGRINKEILKEIIQTSTFNLFSLSTEYFLCGPIGLMETIIKTLVDLNVDLDNIHWESFGGALSQFRSSKKGKENSNVLLNTNQNTSRSIIEDKPTGITAKNKAAKVRIHYEDVTYNIEVEPNQTILEAALDEDIDLPFACSSGTCNVCQAKCLKGKVEMEEDEGLTQEEIEENYILTCVSRPITDEVEIDIE